VNVTLTVNGAPVTLSPGFSIPNPGGNATEVGIYVDSTNAGPWARIVDFAVR